MDGLSNDALLEQFPPCLRNNIKEIWLDGKIGISGMNLDLLPFLNKRIAEDDTEFYSYQFLLKVPYAGKLLEWEVIFNQEDYEFAPDFDFRDEYFLADPDLDVLVKNVPSLIEWNLQNPKALITVLREFIQFYRKEQLERLQTDAAFEKLSEEYELLVNSDGIGEDNVEVNVDNGQAVTFLISAEIDISCLPPYVQPKYIENGIESQKLLNCGDDTALLKIHFQKPEGGRITTQLLLSPRLEQLLGNYSDLHIPPYQKENRLIDYVNDVIKLVNERVKDIERHHQLKNEYISCLLSMHAKKIVEYDSLKFTRAVLLCEVDGYCCLVCISIGNRFPTERPVVVLRSVHNLSFKKLCSVPLNYFYSPRWKPEEMITRLFKELVTAIPKSKQLHNI